MFEVKTVSRGNSLAISLPSDSKFNFKRGQRWLLIPSEDGTAFTLVPRIENPYTESTTNGSMSEEWGDVRFDEVE